jgi:hypothetical protein
LCGERLPPVVDGHVVGWSTKCSSISLRPVVV